MATEGARVMGWVPQQGGGKPGALMTMADVLFGDKTILPTPANIYLQAMLGRKKAITADDFSAGEIDVIRQMARDSGGGHQDYGYWPYDRTWDETPPDSESYLGPLLGRLWSGRPENFDAAANVQTTLGGYRIDPTVEGYRVTDTYDFHDEYDTGEPVIPMVWDSIVSPRRGKMSRILENMAIRYGPSATRGNGIPVDFTIPYEADSEPDQMNRKRVIQQLLAAM